MNEFYQQIDDLASLMEEHQIVKMEYSSEELSICFSKVLSEPKISQPIDTVTHEPFQKSIQETQQPASNSKRAPVLSPLTGIFYSTSDPSTPSFVKMGDSVFQGQVIGLVEAMKVFNEIIAPHSGIVSDYCAKHGQLVQVNDPLIYISLDSEPSL